MARLPLMAGRACGDADALRTQVRYDVGAGIPYQRHRQNVGGRTLAHGNHAAHGQQLLPAIGLQSGHVGQLGVIIGQPQLHRLGKAGDLGRGLGAGARAALLSAAGQQGAGVPHPGTDVQRAHALWPADLVTGQAHQVYAPALRVAGDLQKALHRVAVQQGRGTLLPQQGSDVRRGKYAARLVVHQHHRHQGGVLPQGIRHLFGGDIAVPSWLQIGDLIPLLGQQLAGLQNGAVLHGGGDDVSAPVPVLPQGGLYGPVVALRAAGGEVQALRGAAQRPGDDGPPALHGFFHLHPYGVLGGGIAEVRRQHLVHGVGHGFGHRRGGGVIKIDHREPPVSRTGLERHGKIQYNKPIKKRE